MHYGLIGMRLMLARMKIEIGKRFITEVCEGIPVASPVTTYKLSPEEIQERYGHIKGTGKKPFVFVADGKRNRKHGRYAQT